MTERISVMYNGAFEIIRASLQRQPAIIWEIDRGVPVEARPLLMKTAQES